MTPIKKEEKKEDFVKFYESSACNVSVTCKRIGISRNTFYEWCKQDDDFATRIKDEEEALLDYAETMLFKGIKDGKTAELIFFLKTKGKKRGYIERQEITGADGDNLFVVRIVDSIDENDERERDPN